MTIKARAKGSTAPDEKRERVLETWVRLCGWVRRNRRMD